MDVSKCLNILIFFYYYFNVTYLFVADDDDVIVQRRIATVQVCLTLSDKFEPNTTTASVTKLFIKYVYYKA